MPCTVTTWHDLAGGGEELVAFGQALVGGYVDAVAGADGVVETLLVDGGALAHALEHRAQVAEIGSGRHGVGLRVRRQGREMPFCVQQSHFFLR